MSPGVPPPGPGSLPGGELAGAPPAAPGTVVAGPVPAAAFPAVAGGGRWRVVVLIAVVVLVAIPARARSPADLGQAAAASPSASRGGTPGAGPQPVITRKAAHQVLARFTSVNNEANKQYDNTLLATIEGGSSYVMDTGTYRMARVTDPKASQYAPLARSRPSTTSRASRPLPALLRGQGGERGPGQPAARDLHPVPAVRPGGAGRPVEGRNRAQRVLRRPARSRDRGRCPGLRAAGQRDRQSERAQHGAREDPGRHHQLARQGGRRRGRPRECGKPRRPARRDLLARPFPSGTVTTRTLGPGPAFGLRTAAAAPCSSTR